VITGYEWVSAGSVDVLGETLGQTDVRALRQRISIVNPADRYGVDGSLTAHEAALTGYFGSLKLYEKVNAEQRDHAQHLLRAVGLGHRLTHRYHLLSTGEQRRCLLARAMVQIPELLILDEPTAGLDVFAREHLLATIDQLHCSPDPPSILMVTHHVEEISKLKKGLDRTRESFVGGLRTLLSGRTLDDALIDELERRDPGGRRRRTTGALIEGIRATTRRASSPRARTSSTT
jgi:ABC-type molybdenum transport system ATPase subunit/photorepair protein PhrA